MQKNKLNLLKQELKKSNAKLAELEQLLEKNNESISSLKGGIVERDKKITDVMAKYELKTQQLNLTIEQRRVVEANYQSQIQRLRLRNAHFETKLFQTAFKRFLFNTLKIIRTCLPLTKKTKESLTFKLSGLSNTLNGDVNNKLPDENLDDNLGIDLDIEFTEYSNPEVSIIIPIHNEITQTIFTLKYIFQQLCTFSYEVIILDDASSDTFRDVLKNIKGLRYHRNSEPLGTIKTLNNYSKVVKGSYILFLENGVLLHPGCLQSMSDSFKHHIELGVVGGKLLDEKGAIKSIGGNIDKETTISNLGHGQDQAHPRYNYVRKLDCVNEQIFMIKTQLLESLNGFTESFTDLQYAVSDLCCKVRKNGKTVLYQPKSVSNELETKKDNKNSKEVISKNKKIFNHHWNKTDAEHSLHFTKKPLGSILYVDATTPEPNKDAGSVNAKYSMKAFLELGYNVQFIPGTNFAYWNEATRSLQQMGVECIYHPFYSDMASFLNERKNDLDYVVLSRVCCNELFLKIIRQYCPRAKIINNTVDLHFLRMEREAKIQGNKEIALAAKNIKAIELEIMRDTDATILLSEFEHETLAKIKNIKNKLWTIPLVLPEAKRLVSYNNTNNIVFIGGYNHPPNVDAVDWLVQEIWPEMFKKLPGVKLIICGSSMPNRFHDYANKNIELRGFVEDLDELLSQTRLTLAPLRFGAGLKGKVASSIGAGVPCIGTPIAFEGMNEKGLSKVRLEVSTPLEFAELAQKVYFDENYWNNLSKNGCDYYNNNYAYKSVSGKISELLGSL